MNLLLAVIMLLITLAVLMLVFRVVIWGMGELGFAIPPNILKILYFIAALVVIYVIAQWAMANFALPTVG